MHRKRVIHLDDHNLFSTGLKNVLKKEFPNVYYLHFQDVDEALQYIANAIDENELISLLVTDFNHVGINGYEFAKKVRGLELGKLARIPILLLSMTTESNPKVQDGLQEKVFDFYLPKSASPEDITEVVKSIQS